MSQADAASVEGEARDKPTTTGTGCYKNYDHNLFARHKRKNSKSPKTTPNRQQSQRMIQRDSRNSSPQLVDVSYDDDEDDDDMIMQVTSNVLTSPNNVNERESRSRTRQSQNSAPIIPPHHHHHHHQPISSSGSLVDSGIVLKSQGHAMQGASAQAANQANLLLGQRDQVTHSIPFYRKLRSFLHDKFFLPRFFVLFYKPIQKTYKLVSLVFIFDITRYFTTPTPTANYFYFSVV